MNDLQRGVCKWAWDHIHARDFVIIDTETTGLTQTAEVVQIVIINAWGRVAFSSLVKPSKPIDESGPAFAVHGISNAMLQHAPTIADIYGPLLKCLTFLCPIAYNADFDWRIIEQTLLIERLPALISESQWECAMKEYATFDTGVINGRWKKLQQACAQMGLTTDRDWHDAAADARATYELIEALAARAEHTAKDSEPNYYDYVYYQADDGSCYPTWEDSQDVEGGLCPVCQGKGYIVTCVDDVCDIHNCMQGEEACPECGGDDEISNDGSF